MTAFTSYESYPGSTLPNTINVCEAVEFEITDMFNSSSGRCYVPVVESTHEWYLLYLATPNPNATLPSIGTVVPQSTGDWNVVLNAGNIPQYNQANFPSMGLGYINNFTISNPGAYAIIGVICEINANNDYVIISQSLGSVFSPVSNKIFLNYLEVGSPIPIVGDQHLCEGASVIYSMPAHLAGMNPVWNVDGGTYTGSGSSIQVNWDATYTGQRRVSVYIQIGNGWCEAEGELLVYDCCIIDALDAYNVFDAQLSETIFGGKGLANPGNTGGITRVGINGYLHIDEDIELNNINLLLGPNSKITIADNVHFVVKNAEITAGCGNMFDGVYVTDPSQKLTLESVRVNLGINAIVSKNGGLIEVFNSRFTGNLIGISVLDYNPNVVANYIGSSSPLEMYGNIFVSTTFPIPPYQGIPAAIAAIKVENSGFVQVGESNQSPNLFNPTQPNTAWLSMPRAILMNNSGGNIVNNQFFKNNVVGSPSQVGAIVATTTNHQSWIQPLQIGRLWSGGAAGDANYFEEGVQAIRTTNVRSVFVRENTFKNYLRNIDLINASNQRVVQLNRINHQLGSSGNPLISFSGIVVASTHGVPTSGGVISDNHIEASTHGIFMSTVNSMTVNRNDIFTFSATSASQTSVRSGISATNGWNINVYMNNLQHNNMPLNSDLTGNNLRGINLNNVVDAYVGDNYVLRYGAGIYAANDNRVSQFRCNFLQSSIWGFNFNNVYLDQQGNPGDPTDNQWVGNRRAIRTNGTADNNMPQRNWHFRTGAEFSIEQLSFDLLGSVVPSLTGGGEVSCTNVVLPNDTTPSDDEKYNDPEIIEEVFGAVVDSSVQFSSASVQYFEESMTYRILDQNPAIIQQTNTHQQAFDDFYTAHNTSSKGDVKRLYDALLGKTTDDYEQLLSTFQPSNTFENKIAQVSFIYAQSWAKGRFELDSAERSVLLPIAQADASTWGEAVYTARVMLGMFDLDENVGSSGHRRGIEEIVLPETALGKAYPNPTAGAFSFAGSQETGFEQGALKIYDLQGRLVAQPVVLFNDGAWQVADPQLKAGMYMYRLYIDGTEQLHGKIIIQ